MGLLWMQPHKEDRFVFPIYPLIVLAASICIKQFEVKNFDLKDRSLILYEFIEFYSTSCSFDQIES